MIMPDLPRPEYPRPQFVRPDWLCLNGVWQFEIDAGDSGKERGLLDRPLDREINVPFCPESTLSGIGHVDFMRVVWYRREIEVPAAWEGKRVLLHFGGVDDDVTVWCDGREVARHRGGAIGFGCDLGEVAGRTVTLIIRCRDFHDGP
jgi:beta-galactosidase/beta-glucuronidase